MNNKKKDKAGLIYERLKKAYPDAACALDYGGDPWRLLVMARLSAQCTDARVNLVSKTLFNKYPDAASMAKADISELERDIMSCGLFRMKAKQIKEASAVITDKYNGALPGNMEELLSLPGVGRKIANLIMGDVFGGGGIVTDTHLIRICGRLGFYSESEKSPVKTERIMTPLLEKEKQSEFCHMIVLFGREYCTARSPRCGECPLRELCAKRVKEMRGR